MTRGAPCLSTTKLLHVEYDDNVAVLIIGVVEARRTGYRAWQGGYGIEAQLFRSQSRKLVTSMSGLSAFK
jgi:hypothetical protein